MKLRYVCILALAAVVLIAALAVGVGLETNDGGAGDGTAYSIPVRLNTRTFCRDVGGVGGWETDELLDGDMYWMAWTDSGKSERIPVSAAVKTCQAITTQSGMGMRYVFYISTPAADDYLDTPSSTGDGGNPELYAGERDGRKWDLFRFPSDAGDFNEGVWMMECSQPWPVLDECDPKGAAEKTPMPAPLPFKIEGKKYLDADNTEKFIYDGAVLRVEYQQFFIRIEPGNAYVWWETLVVDEARIRSAVPDVSWEAESYKAGETARLRFDLPELTIDGEEAYYLSVVDLNDMHAVEDADGNTLMRVPFSDLADSPTGVLEIPVTAGMFANEEPCTNALQARVYSPILQVDEDETSVLPETVLSPGSRPEISGVTFDKEQYNKGDSAVVTARATGNVTKWTMDATIEGLEALPLTTYNQATNALNVSFNLPVSGLLKVHTRAYTACLPSDTHEVRMDVGREFGPYCLRNPSDPLCHKDDVEISPWMILAIALLFGFVAAMVTFAATGGKAAWARILLAVLAFAVVSVIVYLIALLVVAVLKLIMLPWWGV